MDAIYFIDRSGHLIKKVYTGVRVYDYFIGRVSGVKLTTSGEPMLCTFK